MWNIEKVRSGKPNKWNYIDGCMITACLSLYHTTRDKKYLDFSKDFIDYFVQEDGSIKTYDPKSANLDNVNQGKNLFSSCTTFRGREVPQGHRHHPQPAAHPAPHQGGQLLAQGHLSLAGGLDGTYMAQPFYMEYETRYNKMQGCIDSYKQFMNIQSTWGRNHRPVLPRLRREPPDVLGRPRHRLQPQLLAARHGLVHGGHGGRAGAHGRAAVQRVPRHHGHAQADHRGRARSRTRRPACSGR